MQRLTENDGKGNWSLKGLPWWELSPGKELTAEACQLLYGALYKLKDLEDAGLHPKSAEAIDWLYLQKCKEVNELRKKIKWMSEGRLIDADRLTKDIAAWEKSWKDGPRSSFRKEMLNGILEIIQSQPTVNAQEAET